MPSDLREAFEDWAIRNWYPVKRTPTDEYDDEETRDAYEGWLACAKHIQEKIKDAERYQWIRDEQNVGHPAWWMLIEPECVSKKMDEVIDAAIAATKGENDA